MTCFHLFFLQIDIDLSLGARSSVDKGGGYWKEKVENIWLSKNNQESLRSVEEKYVEEASKGPDDVMGLMTVTWFVK